ncbi:MAG: coniferyl aldehyde dehydrogenase [Gammaproteobacteria bacterium]|nr:coniferyl aldehyde dehydrogenase [Gammaproteobacteria bacterium]
MTAGSGAADLAGTELALLFERQRAASRRDPYPELALRRDRLRRLLAVVQEDGAAIEAAIAADFGQRSRDETLAFEVLTSVLEIRHTLGHLGRWMRDERRPATPLSWPGRARIVRQPLGVVGIVVPWNYPLYLAVSPLVAALAAGNRALVKTSEFTPHCSALLAERVARRFAGDELAIVQGGVAVARAFAALPFDHLLFTGSTGVGRQVMAAAAANLTPVTLELGGKSPAIVADDAPLESTVRQVLFGKLANAGQTCVAPDYVLLPRALQQPFLALARRVTMEFYPRLQGNPDYTSIASEAQAARLRGLVADAAAGGATIHRLHDEPEPAGSRQLAPLALTGVSDDMRVMQEEIFGPLLPLVPCDDLQQAIDYVNRRPRPLALYLFTRDRQRIRQVLRTTTSGGAVVNDVMLHVIQNDLPFGGVGPSGMGRYHGREGFDTFSQLKGVFYQSRINGGFLLRPPRTAGWLRRVAGWLSR